MGGHGAGVTQIVLCVSLRRWVVALGLIRSPHTQVEEDLLLVDICTNSTKTTTTTAIRLLLPLELELFSSAAKGFVGVSLVSFLHIKPAILSSLKNFANLKHFARNQL